MWEIGLRFAPGLPPGWLSSHQGLRENGPSKLFWYKWKWFIKTILVHIVSIVMDSKPQSRSDNRANGQQLLQSGV